jgi:hypothetical protein
MFHVVTGTLENWNNQSLTKEFGSWLWEQAKNDLAPSG